MLKLDNISVSFAGKNVFDNISFILNDGEKLGLIGRNGCGKTTLLKVIAGEIIPDTGTITTSKNYKIGYLKQHLNFTEKNIVDEVCLSLPDYKKDHFWEVEEILLKLGFTVDDLKKSPEVFSGGWQIKLNLAKLLASESDLILLDEPTNYLDIMSIRWLRSFLQNLKQSFILITHDRSFLNSVIDHTLIIHRKVSKKITGNVDDMYKQIEADEETYEKTRINEDKKRAQLQKVVDRFRYKATLARMVQSVIKKIDRIDVKEELVDEQDLSFDFQYLPTITNKPFFQLHDISFGYEQNKMLIKNLTLDIKQGDKICVIGRNGKGKSTLLKLLYNEMKVLSGDIEVNDKVKIGYFGQMNVNRMNLENTIQDELWEIDKTMPRSKILNVAGKMMFSGDDPQKKLKVLSGGEKNRVLLGKIILEQFNTLLLDEPTNHLDMESCLALMDAVNNFKGTVITVTHNEDFLNNVAEKLIVFDNDKTFLFDGGYQDFLSKIGWVDEEEIVVTKPKKHEVQKVDEQSTAKKPNIKFLQKQKGKLENEILDLEITLEEEVLQGNYNVSSLQKDIDTKTIELERINKLLK